MQRLALLLLAACLFAPTLAGAAPDGAPEILALDVDRTTLDGGQEVTVEGRNFTNDTRIVLGDAVVTDATVESSERLRFRVPPQLFAGARTLTIRTAAGVDQRAFHVLARRIDEIADLEITSVAGGVPYVGDGAVATDARVGLKPHGVVVDGEGNLFVSDPRNHRVRRIDAATGVITTYAGNGSAGFGGDGGPAVAASLDEPTGLAFDLDGSLLIADRVNRRIRRVDRATGVISTIDVVADYAVFAPIDLAVDASGDLYVANYAVSDTFYGTLRRIDRETGEAFPIDVDFGYENSLIGVAADGTGAILIVVAHSQSLGRYDPATDTLEMSDFGYLDSYYSDVLPGDDGDLFLVDSSFDKVVRFDPETRTTTLVAGSGEQGFGGDGGPATEARLFNPQSIARDEAGNVYIADLGNRRLRKVDAAGTISTVVGTGRGETFNTGWPATSARVGTANVALGPDGGVYATMGAQVVRVDLEANTIAVIAGMGEHSLGGDGGPATEAQLSHPEGIAVDKRGNIYVADTENFRIRRIDAVTGTIETVVEFERYTRPTALALRGSKQLYFMVGTQVHRVNLKTKAVREVVDIGDFSIVESLTVDRSGRIFASNYSTIYRIDPSTGTAKRIAGTDWAGTRGDGGPPRKALVAPTGLAVDRRGDVYISNLYTELPPTDSFSATIRRIDMERNRIDRVAGRIDSFGDYSGDGGPAWGAGFAPHGIAFDGDGNLLIADASNARIRVIKGLGRR